MRRWLRRRKLQANCFHHDIGGNPANTKIAFSWINQKLIDLGRRKLFWCSKCRKVWIV